MTERISTEQQKILREVDRTNLFSTEEKLSANQTSHRIRKKGLEILEEFESLIQPDLIVLDDNERDQKLRMVKQACWQLYMFHLQVIQTIHFIMETRKKEMESLDHYNQLIIPNL